MTDQPETLDNRLEAINRRRMAENRIATSNARRRINDINRYRNSVIDTEPEVYWDIMNASNTIRLTDILNMQNPPERNGSRIIYWPDYKVFGTIDEIFNTFGLADMSQIAAGALYTLTDGQFGNSPGVLPLSLRNIFNNSYNPATSKQKQMLIDIYSSDIPRYDRIVYLSQYRLRGTTREIYNTLRQSGLELFDIEGILLDLNEENIYQNSIRENEIPEIEPVENKLFLESYEALLRQLYNLPIVNKLKGNLISFEQVGSIQIERYIIDPLLQAFSTMGENANKIITIFDTNGITYLVKARYDPISHQIFSPI